ncbi:hypothetical protein EVAR_25722_1 [Eumeta japonica]|uniref:Uncharacterized protein n=1 Tax=Eumeta variegata TaxID=151549 RepID=A0A4C1YQ44_EUMVA|nr:hypothetical protein EVAR_25722_1 [Eumeta japonica]
MVCRGKGGGWRVEGGQVLPPKYGRYPFSNKCFPCTTHYMRLMLRSRSLAPIPQPKQYCLIKSGRGPSGNGSVVKILIERSRAQKVHSCFPWERRLAARSRPGSASYDEAASARNNKEDINRRSLAAPARMCRNNFHPTRKKPIRLYKWIYIAAYGRKVKSLRNGKRKVDPKFSFPFGAYRGASGPRRAQRFSGGRAGFQSRFRITLPFVLYDIYIKTAHSPSGLLSGFPILSTKAAA